jgi:hypothetical protein
MEIPNTYSLNEVNRVLFCVYDLTKGSNICSVRSIIELCSSSSFGGRLVNFMEIIKLCQYANLLILKSGKVKITQDGLDFISLNPSHYYEINERQKRFIAEKFLFLGPWRSSLRNFLLIFSPNPSKFTYELTIVDALILADHQSLVHLLKVLGVILEENGYLCVAPNYVASAGNLRTELSGKTEEELKALLEANEKLANQAEDAVLAYEKIRLQNLGRYIEASLVKKISKLNVSAGYDILSFNGDQPELDYNRFIEVKASVNNELRFYWSTNERRIAENLSNKYWIYFVGGIKKSTTEIVPILIQDPVRKIKELPELNEQADHYLVTLENRLNLSAFEDKQIKGFLL